MIYQGWGLNLRSVALGACHAPVFVEDYSDFVLLSVFLEVSLMASDYQCRSLPSLPDEAHLSSCKSWERRLLY